MQYAITVRNPWAYAIAIGVKSIENRCWPTKFRGRIYIHAASKADTDPAAVERCRQLLAAQGITMPPLETLPRGVLVARAKLTDCGHFFDDPWAVEDSWHFKLTEAQRITPVPMRGALGIWKITSPLAFCAHGVDIDSACASCITEAGARAAVQSP
jgi:ASCH domain